MPTDHDNKNSEHPPRKSIPDRRKNTPIVNLTVNTGIDQVRNTNGEDDEQHSADKHITINISNPQTDNSPQITGNKIADRAVIVNWALFGCTLVLAIISTWQGCLTRQSVSLADSVFKATKEYNSQSIKTQQDIYKKSIKDGITQDSLNDSTSNRQKRSVDAQIKAFGETQKDFESINDPVLQAGNFIVTFDENGIAKIKYDIINLGKQYVKVVSIKSGVATTNFILSDNEVDSLLKSKDVTKTPFNGYIGMMPFHMGKTMPTKYTSFEKYGKFIFFTVVGEIYYFNPISKKHKTYRFADKINEMGEINYTTIVDFNK